MTPLGIGSIFTGKYLSQRWIPFMKGASGKAHPLFKEMFNHLCYNDPNLISKPILISLGSIDRTV
jgi:hypothetical protein